MGKRMSDSQHALLTLKLWQNKFNTNEIDYDAATKWGIEQKHYNKPPISQQERFIAEMRRAVKRDTYTDPQGRTNKTYGSLPLFDELGNKSYKQIDMRIAEPNDAKAVLDDEFKGIENDVKSHSTRLSSYNDNNLFGATLGDYDYDLNYVAQSITANGAYDDSFDEDDFSFDEGE
jgi:hypothetical protein